MLMHKVYIHITGKISMNDARIAKNYVNVTKGFGS